MPTLVLSEKKILNEIKNHNLPCKLNGRSLKGYIPKMNLDFIQYRSYKNVDMEKFKDDVRSIDFENLVSVENVELKHIQIFSQLLLKLSINI